MTDTSTYTCSDLNAAFVYNENFINEEIASRRKVGKRLWIDFIERGTFVDGEGLIRRKEIFHPGFEPAGSSDWDQVEKYRPEDHEDGAHNPCDNSCEIVTTGMEEKSYTLYRKCLRTYDLCLQDIRYDWQFTKQVDLQYSNLADISLRMWENFNRARYWKDFSTNLLCIDGAAFLASYTLPASVAYPSLPNPVGRAVGPLTQGHLDLLYQYLARDYADYGVSYSDGSPDFGLVTSMETSDRLIKQDATLREDFRYGDAMSLLKGYGARRMFRNYVHIHDIETPRFNVNGVTGDIVEVAPWVTTNTTVGVRRDINPAYLTATFELSLILVPGVFKDLIPPVISSLGGATEFDANTYYGEFKWMNHSAPCINEWREVGHYAARYFAAPEPGTVTGYGILHRLCPEQIVVTDCQECEEVEDPCIGYDVTETAVAACAVVDADTLTITTVGVLTGLSLPAAVTVTFDDDSTGAGDIVAVSSSDPRVLTVDFDEETTCATGGGVASIAVDPE